MNTAFLRLPVCD